MVRSGMKNRTWSAALARIPLLAGAFRADHGAGFWLVTVVLALLLPAPVAVAVIVARFRRAPRVEGAAGSVRVALRRGAPDPVP
jgi:hypothetical protein